MKSETGFLSRLRASGLADLARRGRWMARSFVGRDLYYRPKIRAAKQRHGGRPGTGYGAWTICPEKLTRQSIVYSLGVGDDISFELSLLRSFSLPAVFAFDPTPAAIAWLAGQSVPQEFRLLPYAIASWDGSAKLFPHENPEFVAHSLLPREATAGGAVEVEVRTLATVMAELGHRHIDLLKMDIEGAEYGVIDNLLQDRIEIGQLLVEFHHHDRRTLGMSLARTQEALRELDRAGYKLFYVTPRGEEYSFLRT